MNPLHEQIAAHLAANADTLGAQTIDLLREAHTVALADYERRTGEWSEYDYYQCTVRSIAARIMGSLAKGDAADANDLVHEAVDSSAWIIYYHGQRRVLDYTRNEDALCDVYSELSFETLSDVLQIAAYYAMKADVHEALSDLTVADLDLTDVARGVVAGALADYDAMDPQTGAAFVATLVDSAAAQLADILDDRTDGIVAPDNDEVRDVVADVFAMLGADTWEDCYAASRARKW